MDMSADVSTVEPHGGTDEPTSVRRLRRRRVVALVVTLAAVITGAGLWWSQSSPALVAGSTVGPSGGTQVVADTDPLAPSGAEIWRQTSPRAWAAWSVRNEGRYAVTLTSAVATNADTFMPRLHLRFLAAPPQGGTPDGLAGATPTGLVDSLTIAPGEEGYLVADVYFPAQCLAGAAPSLQDVATYGWTTAGIDARVLGRTTTLVVPLPRRIETPALAGTCPLEAFGGQ